MAETQRSSAELLLLLADNTTGQISAQDIRDIVYSLIVPHGKLSISNNALETAIATIGAYVKAEGVFTAGGNGSNFTEGIDGKLTYTGADNRHIHMVATITVSANGVNQNIGVKIAKNGVLLEDSKAVAIIKASGDGISIACHADAHLSTDDYIEIYVGNETSTVNVTLINSYFFAMGMFS